MAFLQGFGAHLPQRVVSNQEMAVLTGSSPEWILSVSGIEERRFADPEQTVADLATAAAQDCLQRCSMTAASLGMVIVASGSAGRSFPGPALTLAGRLSLALPPAIDLPL